MQKLLPFTKRNAFCAMGGRGVARLQNFLECESVSFRFAHIESQGSLIVDRFLRQGSVFRIQVELIYEVFWKCGSMSFHFVIGSRKRFELRPHKFADPTPTKCDVK